MCLVGLVFYLLKDYLFSQKVDPIVSFAPDAVQEEELEREVVTQTVKKKPSAPSSAQTKVIVAAASSPVSIPTPEVAVDSLAVDFGEYEGFGDGFGDGFGAGGFGGGGGSFSFMGAQSSANDVVFVIDWSESMDEKRGRFELLQAELRKTFKDFPNNATTQIIMFAGPSWPVTDINNPDSVPGAKQAKGFVFKTKDANTGKEYAYKGSSIHGWKQISPSTPRRVEWTRMSDAYRKKLMNFVNKGQLCLGTSWEPPLMAALNMKPAPKTIVFLTDGATGNVVNVVQNVSKRARSTGTVIKTIALMEPKAENGMRALAEKTKGSFTLVTGLSERDRKVTDYSK